ncbi:PQ loop repeat-domain-containing protein [Gilbertella persicaria]|uniref:PQ loop repeat-domain-containing protein n=1 Tax=Gilbertella persicaria TaxID=101096 RepID=UPI002220E3C2|nr:PQ loop repeat-domain-containing protein [Gilbertella persicaria]KAI8047590.1 PQ loop repeat-domain-containing protein [Gilbertella persicaria]
MECIPTEDTDAYLRWINSVLGICIHSYLNALSVFLGYLSIFCWLNAQIPQVMKNYKLRSADGLSLYLLYFWLAGDLGNMLSCILNSQLPFQIYLATYFVSTDLILLFQYFYYGKGDLQCSEDDWKINTFDQLANDEESSALIHENTLELTKTMEDITSVSSKYGSVSNTKTSTMLMGVLLFGWNFGSHPMVSALSTENPVTFGWTLAWICNSLYLLSRIPQIYKNFKRHSTQGLSLALFFFAVSGNVTYALSILAHPGHTAETLMQSLPYLFGSLGTLFLDAIIFGQFLHYRKNTAHVDNTPTTAALTRALTFSSQ